MPTTEFLGCPYPILKNALGYFKTQSGMNQIKADLLALILTNEGERVMLPSYGCSLRKFLFEPADSVVANQVRAKIIEQIDLWEPRVVINNIIVSVNPSRSNLNSRDDLTEKESILYIQIDFFDPEDIKEVQQLKLEVPLGGL